jgi:hypothetical protein
MPTANGLLSLDHQPRQAPIEEPRTTAITDMGAISLRTIRNQLFADIMSIAIRTDQLVIERAEVQAIYKQPQERSTLLVI